MNSFITIILASSFILSTSSLIIEPISEKMSGFKLTQFCLGINNISYWSSLYITHSVKNLLIDILFDYNAPKYWYYVYDGICSI